MTGEAAIAATAGIRPADASERLGSLFDTHHERLYRLARRLSRKSYRLLDTGWTLASNNGVRSTMRLRGLDNQEFELNLSGVSAPPSRLNLSFALSEGGSDARKAQLADLEARGKALADQLLALRVNTLRSTPE